MLRVLLCLHNSQCVSKPLVLYDGRVTHALIFAEDAVGKRVSFPPHLERSICEVIDLDVLTCYAIRQITSFKDDLPAIVSRAELLTYVTLFAVAQDIG